MKGASRYIMKRKRCRDEEVQRHLKALGESIAEQRKQQMLTQIELAKKAHISPAHLSHIERGGNLAVDVLLNIAEGLGVKLETLLNRAADIEGLHRICKSTEKSPNRPE